MDWDCVRLLLRVPVQRDAAYHGCRAVWCLALNRTHCAMLVELGACRAVVEAVRAWGRTDAEVAEWGQAAIYLLAYCEDNRARFRALGAAAVLRASLGTPAKQYALGAF
jgi:hypothetical protein